LSVVAVKASTLIVQISDCHLPANPQQEYRGIKPYEKLQALLLKVGRMNPDLLLATGDLSEDGSPASYRALKRFFSPFGIPVLALPGNHDDAERLAETFPGSPVDRVEVSQHGSWQIIRLNSCLPGKPEGCFREPMLVELEKILACDKQCSRLIAFHHQPVFMACPWIDRFPLLEPEKFLHLIDRYPQVKAVVWGHVHQVYETDRNGTKMLGGPSTAINCLPGARKFTADPIGPAARWVELKADGTVQSGIVQV
jgi:Icc protein